MADKLAEACQKFVATLFEAKSRSTSQEAFDADEALDREYQQLAKTIKRQMDDDVQWQYGFSSFMYGFAEHVWEGEIADETEAARNLFNTLSASLENLSSFEWFACVPMERVFRLFPPFTDFGPFAIVNAVTDPPDTTADVISRFQMILADNLGITFMQSEEVRESYLDLAEHFHRKSGEYIPGRPQLVMRTGRGGQKENEHICGVKLRELIPLLQLTQIIVEQSEGGLRWSGGFSKKPDGKTWMESGLISIPGVAVAINKRTGQADWWSSGLRLFETQYGEGYKPETFMAVWAKVASPVLDLQKAGLSGKLWSSISNAIGLVSQCRYVELGDLTLNCVIGTETLLNPFNAGSDLGERFSLLCAAFLETDAVTRRERYRMARKLYKMRCNAVHRSQLYSENDNAKDSRKESLELFLGCLGRIVEWATKSLQANTPCNQATFDDFCLATIFS